MSSVILNLGCCTDIRSGCVNVDRKSFPGVDVVCDLRERWPWEDNSIDQILAYDIIEHLPDHIHTMNEAWRVLKPGGLFDIIVPTTEGRGAFQDPTHVSLWNRNSFFYYTAGIPERERFGEWYGIAARFLVVRDVLRPYPDHVMKLNITLKAVR